MPFDRDSGLMFNETIVSAKHHRQCRHPNQYKMPPRFRDGRQVLGARGANSLEEMASETLFAKNMFRLDRTALEGVPHSMLERWWRWIWRRGCDSLHAWQVFASTGHFDKTFINTAQIFCMNPPCLTRIALSTDMAWLTNLAIGGMAFDTDFLLSISNISNLRTIHVQLSGPGHDRISFSDRILRAWAADARERGALSRLEMMFIDDQQYLTTNALQYLHHFTALNMFTARDCGINDQNNTTKIEWGSQGRGWRANRP
jgi:hypothetical protein